MKINDLNSVQRVNPYKNQKSVSNVSSNNTREKKIDAVSISSEALEMAKTSSADEVNPVDQVGRAAHIETVKQQIDNGTYSIDTGVLASKVYDRLR